jgi:serine/threonine-protein kinase
VIRRLDRYELVEQVGSGGMAAVYLGRDTALDREVAVKVLHPHLASRAESRARFSREARAVARLSHPNIVEIYDYSGDQARDSYLVTEFVHGRTLRAFAEQVGLGFPEVGVLVARALADALVHAHSAGVIHRDLKPDNVMVCEEPDRRAVKLADFGIARILASDERMTMTGALVGSPNHMAPEIVEGREADERSDLFSLGTLVYWLATGQLPFAAPNPTATLRRVVEGDYQDPRAVEPLVSDRLAAVIARALSADPAARQASAAEMRDELDAVLAEAGLDRPEEELSAFLADPAGYKASLRPRLVSALMAQGEAALRERATARALAAFNRVLALEPENAAVSARLRTMARRARLWRAAGWAGAAALAGALVAGGLALVSRRPAGAPPAGEAAAPPPPQVSVPAAAAPSTEASPPPPAPTPASPPVRTSPSAAAPSPAEPPRRQRPAASAVELAVHIRPYAQRALLDGAEVARGEQRVVFSIPPGRHVIRVEHECCAPYERAIDAREAARLGEIKVPLEPRPARLRVEGDARTRIYDGPRLLGTAGDSQRSPLPLPVPPGSENPYEGVVELRLEPEGGAPYAAPIRIRAGGDVTVAPPRQEAAP